MGTAMQSTASTIRQKRSITHESSRALFVQRCNYNKLFVSNRTAPKQRLCLLKSSSNGGGGSSGFAAEAAEPTATILQACKERNVDPADVVAAMQQLEAAHSKSSLVSEFPQSLQGTWRLVFATPGPPLIKSWQYIPVDEDAVIDVAAGTIDLVGTLGPLVNRFKGRCKFEANPTSGAYDMVFGWDTLETTLFSWQSVRELPPKEKVYRFFVLRDNVAIANSSGTGGRTLMYRLPQ